MGGRHHDPCHGDGADEFERIEVLLVLQRRALHLDQHVDGHALRVARQIGQRHQEARPIFCLLAHADDAAGADLHAGAAHMLQGIEPVLIGAGGDDVAVKLRRGVEVVVVVVKAGCTEARRLIGGEHPERHAGLHAEPAHLFNHSQDVGHVLLFGVAPGGPMQKRDEPLALASRARSSTFSTSISRSASRPV